MAEPKIESVDIDMDRETCLESMDANITVKVESVEISEQNQTTSKPPNSGSSLEEKIEQARLRSQRTRRVSYLP